VTRRPRRPRAAAFSERGFHEWLKAGVRATRDVPLPIGDDAAALRLSGARVALLTTDALVEGTHFLPSSPPRALGRTAAAVSLSDIAAKGGRPLALLLDLLLPPTTDPRWARAVASGAREEMRRWGADLVGGDTKPAGQRAIIGTVFAEGDRRDLSPRSGARPGDVVLTTGTVGRGGAAAWALDTEGPTPRVLRSLLGAHPRLFEGRVLSRYAHAMVDTSDGLAEGARLIAEASHVRLEVDRDRLPVHASLRRIPEGEPRESALFFGGDYELLATVSRLKANRLIERVRRVGGVATRIGTVRPGNGAFLLRAGRAEPMPDAGWRPFEWALARAGASQPSG
jgi:thiamine-monophosphate kinase